MNTLLQEAPPPRLIEDLEAQIATLSARRTELASDLALAGRTLDAARADLIAGTQRTPTKVTQAQAAYTALEEALVSLDAQLEQLRSDLAQGQAAAAREGELARLVALSHAAAAGRVRLEAAFHTADAALARALSEMLEGFRAWSEARSDFQLGVRALAPGMHALTYKHDPEAEQLHDSVLAELEQRGADLTAGFATGWWNGRTFRAYDYALPSLPLGGPIAMAFNLVRTGGVVVAQERIALHGTLDAPTTTASDVLGRGAKSLPS